MNNHVNMKKCIFCDTELKKGKTKAVEHVISRDFLNKIGMLNKVQKGRYYEGEKSVNSRSYVWKSVISGHVCSECNNGWMNSLDKRVEPILFKAFSGEFVLSELSETEKFELCRYLLKTAISYIGTDAIDRRHIPEKIIKSIKNPDYLPNGLICFMTKFSVSAESFFLCRIDMWNNEVYLATKSQSQRLKFGIQLNDISFCIAWLDCGLPTFLPILNFHNLIYSNESNIVWVDKPSKNINLRSNMLQCNVDFSLATLAGILKPPTIDPSI